MRSTLGRVLRRVATRPCRPASWVLGGCLAVALLGAMPLVSGCNYAGLVMAKMPPPVVPPAYDGLAGRSVAVMVWVDPAVDLDFEYLSLQLAQAVQRNLEAGRDQPLRGWDKALAGAHFPIPPQSIVRYQKQEPMLATMRAADIAPRLGVDRVIYIEVDRFTTQGAAAAGLWKGVAHYNVQVLEVNQPDPAAPITASAAGISGYLGRVTTVGYSESDVAALFPAKSKEGSATLGGEKTYVGLVLASAEEIARRFVPHHQPED